MKIPHHSELKQRTDSALSVAREPKKAILAYAGIKKEVMIVGRAGQAEIWDAEEFNSFEMENLSPEKLLASLEAIGL